MTGPRAFRARLERDGGPGSWTTATVPFDVHEAFGSRARVPVTATVNGVEYRTSLMPRGDGSHFLVVNADVRKAARADAGDEVDVTVTEDAAPREVEAPPSLADALAGAPDARAAWDALAPSHKREYARWIEDAKRDDTRARRVEKALALLAEGKRLK